MILQAILAKREKGICILSFGMPHTFDVYSVGNDSIDAGCPGTRALSQLQILDRVIHRLNYDIGKEGGLRPCEIFDMIGGSGTGGFIAILLTVFEMTMEEALDEFGQLSVNVLDNRNLDAEARIAALITHINDLLERRNIEPGRRILNDNVVLPPRCKLVVPISYKAAASISFPLRNFEGRNEQTKNLTLAEALLTTITTPPDFTSISIPDVTPGTIAFENDKVGDWKNSLEKLVRASLNTAKDAQKQLGPSSIYHRFNVAYGLEAGQCPPPGTVIAHIDNYLGEKSTSEDVDACVTLLKFRKGMVPLRHLERLGFQEISMPTVPLRRFSSIYVLILIVCLVIILCLVANYLKPDCQGHAGPPSQSPVITLKNEPMKKLIERSLDENGIQHDSLAHAVLPPQAPNFVPRDEPMKELAKGLLGRDIRQRIMVLSGMGGSGKSQLAIRFAEQYRTRFTFVLFIDASSLTTIQAGFISRMSGIDERFGRMNTTEILNNFADLSNVISPNWLIILDNVDDPELPLKDFTPQCNHGSILITTRGPSLASLARHAPQSPT
ncbi:hypothetical protein M408DRAFT_28157 [Serendipita vermifera MAFF 305830]|uniref:NB-ARC domain-containing protein n=1 Tax=Serendipita vermifera MAFF 305830 TaxID=933852 RepID=A0A0C3AT18_SERVB|nr:hypothetical protein M408DRAFT_28157 [Serendipita vermifera MAFF 305830]